MERSVCDFSVLSHFAPSLGAGFNRSLQKHHKVRASQIVTKEMLMVGRAFLDNLVAPCPVQEVSKSVLTLFIAFDFLLTWPLSTGPCSMLRHADSESVQV